MDYQPFDLQAAPLNTELLLFVGLSGHMPRILGIGSVLETTSPSDLRKTRIIGWQHRVAFGSPTHFVPLTPLP